VFDKGWFTRYVEAFYWACATLMLVGSKGTTNLENLFTTFSLLTLVSVFAYILSEIGMIISEEN